MTTADEVIRRFGMTPHPEGGHYRVIFADQRQDGSRGALSTIVYLLQAGQISDWHRVDATEIWYFHAGSPLELRMSSDGHVVQTHRLGSGDGCAPQVVVAPHWWQSAATLGDWTLVGCAVAPEFQFEGFEMAPANALIRGH